MSSTVGSALSTADIVGIVIGGVIGLTTVIGIAITLYAMCCRKNNPQNVWPESHPPYSQQYPPNRPYGQPMNTSYYPYQNSYQQPYQQPYHQPIQSQANSNSMINEPPPYSSVHSNGKH